MIRDYYLAAGGALLPARFLHAKLGTKKTPQMLWNVLGTFWNDMEWESQKKTKNRLKSQLFLQCLTHIITTIEIFLFRTLRFVR